MRKFRSFIKRVSFVSQDTIATPLLFLMVGKKPLERLLAGHCDPTGMSATALYDLY